MKKIRSVRGRRILASRWWQATRGRAANPPEQWKVSIFLLFYFFTFLPLTAGDVTVSSPDGKMQVTISDEGGRLYYSATLNGVRVMENSALGLKTSMGDLSRGLRIVDCRQETVERSYQMRGTKASGAHYAATKATLRVEGPEGPDCQSGGTEEGGGTSGKSAGTGPVRMDVVFQVSNHDVAFRYDIPQQRERRRLRIVSELSSFNLPDGTSTFLSPQIGPETGWEQTKPSYEEVYGADAPMDTTSQYGQGYVMPALFHVGGRITNPAERKKAAERSRRIANLAERKKEAELWVLISETGVGSNYCGSHLTDWQAGTGYTIAYPDRGENNGFGSDFAAIPLPGSTPWRTITIGSLRDIAETTISYDLVEPRYEPSTTYRPGRYTWSWLIGQDESVNYDEQVRFIDLAAEMGFEYCLVDNWWDTQIGREGMEELSRYAQGKGVHLMLWYNSNGYWNDAPQGPRDRMSTAIAREQEMTWLERIGVKGIKVDFFGGDKQETMRLYEDILSDANRHGLQVIFHGCTMPRGWERMYPNYVASEAVLASENVFFDERAAMREAYDLTMHPFCRNATGAMDWGGIIMNKYLSPDNKSRHSRKTTDIFELASGIVMQTSVQCVAMQPNNLEELPQMELDFLRELPTTWDETRLIDGYPGRYVVMARRHGDQWYIAGLNAQKEPLTLTLNLPMLNPSGSQIRPSLQCYVDSKKGEPMLTTIKLNNQGQAKVTIQPNGGLIILR